VGASSNIRIHLPVVLSWALLAGCVHPEADDLSKNPYYPFCGSSALGPDVAAFLATHGIDCVSAGGDFGGSDWVVRGTPETRFRARSLVLRQVRNAGWLVSWPADGIVLMNEWDQIGFEKGPWIRLASVRHRERPTEEVLDRLSHAGISTLFYFGEASDVVFVKAKDAEASIALLRKAVEASVTIHHPKTCAHLPPPVIRRDAPTALTLTISGTDSEHPLREHVDDFVCSYRFSGEGIFQGYSMSSKDRPDGTLVATYELLTIPADATGFLEYSFHFKLDGREYWHGLPSESFRVPLEP